MMGAAIILPFRHSREGWNLSFLQEYRTMSSGRKGSEILAFARMTVIGRSPDPSGRVLAPAFPLKGEGPLDCSRKRLKESV